MQRQIGEIARDAGWLQRDRPVADAIADMSGFCVDPDPTYLKTLRRINKLEAYHSLKHHPALIDLLERMLGGPILPHPRVLMRNIFPAREEYTTQGAIRTSQRSGHHGSIYSLDAADRLSDELAGPLQVAVGSHTGDVYDFGITGSAGGIEANRPARRTLGRRTIWVTSAMCWCSTA